MHIAVVIPIFRRTLWIGKCLEKLNEQSIKKGFEVIIVDDGSPNVLEIGNLVRAYSQKVSFPLKFLSAKHGGPAAARNFAAQNTDAEILCFIDDDSLPMTDWLKSISESFSIEKDLAVLSGHIISLDRDNKLPLLLEKAVYCGKSWATCNIAYRRDVFNQLGGFDESFPEASWEDNDLGLRAQWAGFIHRYNKSAVVMHQHESSMQEYKKKCLLNGRGAAVFSSKYIHKKPLWGLMTPVIMARRLVYGLVPSIWFSREPSIPLLRFYWSLYSLQGYMQKLGKS